MLLCPSVKITSVPAVRRKILGSNIAVDPNIVLKKLTTEDLTIRNAPVGGHTCLTAGERSEPAD